MKKSKGKHRLDKFYHLAKEQGFRSRAAFKLIQLNRKYDFLSSARAVLDLCAAPGGWCQVAVKHMPVGSLILGVDLAPIKPIRGVKTLIGDITTQKCRLAIRKESAGRLFDVVLCDGAPNVGGAWASEAHTQTWLVLEALRMATDTLAPRGTFITKVFRSADYTALLYAFNQLFTKVEATKPAASRAASAEIFVVCQGYKAPAKIDPRLLDGRILFNAAQELPASAGPDALLKHKTKAKRNRSGYEEGASTTHRPLPAAAFVAGDSPIEALGRHTALALDGPASEGPIEGVADGAAAAAFVRGHAATTGEVRALAGDLQVLGRSEFKALLRWRLAVRKDLLKRLGGAGGAGGKPDEAKAKAKEEGEEEEEEDPEERLLREMSEVKERLEHRRKKERKARHEARKKARARAAQLAQAEGIGEEGGAEGESLFSLSSIRGRGAAAGVAEAEAPSSDPDLASSSSGGEALEGGTDDSDIDSDEEQRRYDALMDEYLEESYRSWRQRQRMRDATEVALELKKKRKRLGEGGELAAGEGGSEEEGSGDEGGSKGGKGGGFGRLEALGEEDESEEEGGGLLVPLEERPGKAAAARAAAAQWFSQSVFDDPDLAADDLDEEDSEEEEPSKKAARPAAAAKRKPASAAQGADDLEQRLGPAERRRRRAAAVAAAGGAAAPEPEGFEVVPASDSDASSSDTDSELDVEGLDDNAKAEVLAMSKKLLRRKSKDDLVESAYNRYAFHDVGLPKWFADDEHKHMKPAPPITADEYREAREALRAIDARPIKKVAEAKARKQKRLAMKLTTARQKAEAVANQEDVPMRSRMQQIEKIYAKARSTNKAGKGKAKPTRADQYKKKGPPLDARMRADRRGKDAADRRNKKSGGGGTKKGRVSKPGKGKRGGRR